MHDENEVQEWLMAEASSSSIEEMTGPFLYTMIRQSMHVVVVFCKYLGYVVIAITHTCFILRHLHIDKTASAGGSVSLDRGYLAAEVVRGLANEA